MPLVSFYSKVGKKRAFEEMRTVIVVEGTSLPPGPYGFLEFYCDEVACDCRRVLFHVIRPDTAEKVWATINFGWETPEYYRKWSRGGDMANEMASASLDPLGPQTKHAPELLRLFKEYAQSDAAYVARLKKHYAALKRLCTGGRRLAPADKPGGHTRSRRRNRKGA